MINSYDYVPQTMIKSGQDPFLNSYSATQRVNDLYEEAHHARLAKQYRLAHPELSLRYRAASTLRRLADRIAPAPQSHSARPHLVRTL
ncbi:hypothetical protein [Microlunatus soli]|uniref:Uncharacterized protein n=1 Tax=Microlunatus soli TaxID=630515 RepID=A0A1H1VG35_9ACTN|nr:hypothetical protein [Microlunatus soli]SDS83351.1 hypothetical protein SAMN04489812_3187 [Microlunatus soli]